MLFLVICSAFECAKNVFSIKLTRYRDMAADLKKKAIECPLVYSKKHTQHSFALRIIH